MDRPYDLSPALDPLGLELPFSEQAAPDDMLEALAPDLLADTPFETAPAAALYAGEASGSVVSGEAFADEGMSGEELDFEDEAGTRHQFKDCTPAEKKLLIAAAARGLRAVRHATAFVGSAYGNPARMSAATRQLLQKHFHTVRQRDLIGMLFEEVFDVFHLERLLELPPPATPA